MRNIVYRYACLMRPPGPGAVPRDGLLQCLYDYAMWYPDKYWGEVEYSRQLTPDEIDHYDLEDISNDKTACIS